jgi:hypothetical protein
MRSVDGRNVGMRRVTINSLALSCINQRKEPVNPEEYHMVITTNTIEDLRRIHGVCWRGKA